MGFSEWLKIDLHIHSKESDKAKPNDYSGPEYNSEELINILTKSGINIFSITDHNSINLELYNELIRKQKEIVESKINFIVGAELDIDDKSVCAEGFHSLIFFDLDNICGGIEVIAASIKSLYGGGLPPSISEIFDKFLSSGIREFILLPHYNDKTKGIKERKIKKAKGEKSGIVQCLNGCLFNALEDNNNLEKIQKSFKLYKENGYEDIPVVIFSDCHDIRKYPLGKNKSTGDFTYILGELLSPFNSLKLAFNDASLRVSFDGIVDGRNKSYSPQIYIEKILIDDYKIELSPFFNTIIGGFGSGKSFFKELVLKGKEIKGKNDKYYNLKKEILNFKLIMNDKAEYSNLKETNIKLLILDQNEAIFYKNEIDEEYKKELEEKFSLKFYEIDMEWGYEIKSLEDNYKGLKNFLFEDVPDNINYKILLEKKEKIEILNEKGKKIIKNEGYKAEELIRILEKELQKKIYSKEFYKTEEKIEIEKIIKIIKKRNFENEVFSNIHEYFMEELGKEIREYSDKNNKAHYNSQRNIKEGLENYIEDMIKKIAEFKKTIVKLTEMVSKEKFEEIKGKKEINKINHYKMITQYNLNKNEYLEIEEEVLKKEYRDAGFFKGTLKTLKKSDLFHRAQKQEDVFIKNVKKYIEEYFEENMKKKKYDIEVSDKSILEMSAGQKANELLLLFFNMLETQQFSQIIVVMDQPEDNLDNRNIYDKVVKKIIEMKRENKMVQFIVVTHNSNIAISGDSENIIIAENCKYEYSGLENDEFSEKICHILEGGSEALKRRGMKLGVSLKKEYKVD